MGNFHCSLLVLDIHLASLRRLRPAQQAREHLTRLTLVTIDSLLPEQHQVDVLLVDNLLQHLRDGKRLQAPIVGVGDVDVERAVGAHGHRRAEGISAFGSARGESENVLDFEGTLALTETDGLLDREFVEWVERVLNAGGFDAGLGLVDTGFDLIS